MIRPGFSLTPRADFLSVTCSRDHGALMWDGVSSVLSELPGSSLVSGDLVGWTLPNSGGFVGFREMRGICKLDTTGSMLVALSQHNLLGAFLQGLGDSPHRVTRLDACLDSPRSAPPILRRLYSLGRKGKVQLSRKAAPVTRIMAPGLDGVETGSVYFGSRRATVQAKAYDKRQERYDKTGVDYGPWTRYELTVRGQVGATLHDAYRPLALFWHYMAALLKPPADVPPWHPHGEGFSLPPRPDIPPAGLLKRRLENSSEFNSILAQALSIPGGLILLRAYINRVSGADTVSEVAI